MTGAPGPASPRLYPFDSLQRLAGVINLFGVSKYFLFEHSSFALASFFGVDSVEEKDVFVNFVSYVEISFDVFCAACRVELQPRLSAQSDRDSSNAYRAAVGPCACHSRVL